ncbi:MAG: hypothetical protein IJ420_02930 [Lachnospiraceae bacterium]|nr:hypothetical protein [Lachnospiraceae bacterium]
MTSADIRKARNTLLDFANELPFPMEVKRYIFSEVLGVLNQASEKEIAMIEKKRQESKKGGKEGGKANE